MVSLAITTPYMLAATVYRTGFSQRGFAYLTLGSFLVSMLVYQWVYHRYAEAAPASALPRAELQLSAEPLPRVVWLAILPPVVVMALLWWIVEHGDTLPWRDNWLGPPRPAWNHRMFTMTVMMGIVWNGIAGWKVVHALARWHGMSRSYPYRSQRLHLALGGQWAALIAIACWAAGNNFYMPGIWPTLCALGFGGGMFVVLWISGREERLRRGQPATGT